MWLFLKKGAAKGLLDDTPPNGNPPLLPFLFALLLISPCNEPIKRLASFPTSLNQFVNLFPPVLLLSSDATYLAAGATGDDDEGTNRGACYIYTRSGSTWSEQQVLRPNGLGNGASFGTSCRFNKRPSPSYLIVGAPIDNHTATNGGSAWIFTRSGSTWSEQAELAASDLQGGDYFGFSVDFDGEGDRVVVTSPFHENVTPFNTGAAYVFKRSGSSWSAVFGAVVHTN